MTSALNSGVNCELANSGEGTGPRTCFASRSSEFRPVNGTLQVPGTGQPIVLMPDRGTSGGYPKIATVISADLGRFAQTPAGRPFHFQAVSMAEAQAEARRWFADLLRSLPDRLRPIENVDLNLDALHDANVAGYAVSAIDAGTWQPDIMVPD